MAITRLLNEAKKAESNGNKAALWFFSALLTVVMAYSFWRIQRQSSQLIAAQTELELVEQRAADLRAQAELEENKALAEELLAYADYIVEKVPVESYNVGVRINILKRELQLVSEAKTWQDLRAIAEATTRIKEQNKDAKKPD